MKTACAYFNLEMVVTCPECGQQIDLEDEGYRQTWLIFYKAWVGNDGSKIDNIKQEEDCPHCDSRFLVSQIER